MRMLLLLLSACSADAFVSFEGGLAPPDTGSDSSTKSDSGSDPDAEGGLDPEDSSAESSTDGADASADVGIDSPMCPMGVKACDDAINLWCQRYQQCGFTCTAPSTTSCMNRMVCETACLADIQNATCMKILQTSSPAFVSGNCMGLWQ